MDYTFTSSDITTLGITDETTVNLLLKTTIKGVRIRRRKKGDF